MMKPAEEVMASVLNDLKFSKARFPIVQNVNALATQDGAELRGNLISQISAPVRWIECVEKLKNYDAHNAIEVGSGKVIAGLVKKIDCEGIKTFNINSLAELKTLAAEFEGT